ncbi:hypothetical protein GCM10023075_55700 [Streptosporangium album]
MRSKPPPAGALQLRDERETRTRGFGGGWGGLLIPSAIDPGQAKQTSRRGSRREQAARSRAVSLDPLRPARFPEGGSIADGMSRREMCGYPLNKAR